MPPVTKNLHSSSNTSIHNRLLKLRVARSDYRFFQNCSKTNKLEERLHKRAYWLEKVSLQAYYKKRKAIFLFDQLQEHLAFTADCMKYLSYAAALAR